MFVNKVIPALLVAFSTIALGGCAPNNSGNANSNVGVDRAEQLAKAGAFATGPLPESGFKASISVNNPPTKMRPGQKEVLQVTVKNLGDTTWPSHGRPSDGYFQVNLGNFWFDSKDKRITDNIYIRSGLPNDMRPGEETTIPLEITAPAQSGDYTLEVDLVQEMVTWFAEKGSKSLKFKLKVGD